MARAHAYMPSESIMSTTFPILLCLFGCSGTPLFDKRTMLNEAWMDTVIAISIWTRDHISINWMYVIFSFLFIYVSFRMHCFRAQWPTSGKGDQTTGKRKEPTTREHATPDFFSVLLQMHHFLVKEEYRCILRHSLRAHAASFSVFPTAKFFIRFGGFCIKKNFRSMRREREQQSRNFFSFTKMCWRCEWPSTVENKILCPRCPFGMRGRSLRNQSQRPLIFINRSRLLWYSP